MQHTTHTYAPPVGQGSRCGALHPAVGESTQKNMTCTIAATTTEILNVPPYERSVMCGLLCTYVACMWDMSYGDHVGLSPAPIVPQQIPPFHLLMDR